MFALALQALTGISLNFVNPKQNEVCSAFTFPLVHSALAHSTLARLALAPLERMYVCLSVSFLYWHCELSRVGGSDPSSVLPEHSLKRYRSIMHT